MLSWGESATLAVLPNAPALVFPGKKQQTLIKKRNNLLQKLFEKKYGVNVLISSDFSLEDLAEIKISGSYPVQNQEHLIELLEHTYPIRIEKTFFTKKWVIQKN